MQNRNRWLVSQYHFVVGRGGKKSPARAGDSIQIINYFFTAFLALSATAPILAFAVSATALIVESTLAAVESTTFFELSTIDAAAVSVLAASLLPPPHDV